ncbi:Uncharacterised protein [Yersinia enterocolitica]|nr:Uncharacterised protein [Yersinia enterocolitica]CRE65353.1 Uncharacterised protein [Yersinia enterocolitica]
MSHDCAQLLHTLSGVVHVETEHKSWVILPSHGVWLPAGIYHYLHLAKIKARRYPLNNSSCGKEATKP